VGGENVTCQIIANSSTALFTKDSGSVSLSMITVGTHVKGLIPATQANSASYPKREWVPAKVRRCSVAGE